jgi:hypothetical protein
MGLILDFGRICRHGGKDFKRRNKPYGRSLPRFRLPKGQFPSRTSRLNCSLGISRALCNQVAQPKCCLSSLPLSARSDPKGNPDVCAPWVHKLEPATPRGGPPENRLCTRESIGPVHLFAIARALPSPTSFAFYSLNGKLLFYPVGFRLRPTCSSALWPTGPKLRCVRARFSVRALVWRIGPSRTKSFKSHGVWIFAIGHLNHTADTHLYAPLQAIFRKENRRRSCLASWDYLKKIWRDRTRPFTMFTRQSYSVH